MPRKILVIHGPNLNLLGQREQKVYGRVTLGQINRLLLQEAKKEKVVIDFFQSNHEGEIVTCLQKAENRYDAILLNPAAFTHTSVAIHDAVAAIQVPVIEVHLSNIHSREEFRKQSYVSPVASGVIFGFGKISYLLALKGALALMRGGHRRK